MKRFLHLLGFIFLCLLVFFACKKIDQPKPSLSKNTSPIDRFFTAPADAPDEIKAIAKALKLQNDRHGYLSDVVKKAGYPVWDKARIVNLSNEEVTGKSMNAGDSEIVYIPFVLDSANYVNSLLAVKMDQSDTVFRMLYASNYRKFGYDTTNHSKWSARDVFNIFASFEYSVFGHEKFLILDSNLFKPQNDSLAVIATRTNSSSTQRSAKASTYAVEECGTWQVCSFQTEDFLVAKATSDPCMYIKICTTYYYGGDSGSSGSDTGGWIGTGNGSGDPAGGTGGGGTGGGSSGWYAGGGNPCLRVTVTQKTSVPTPVDGCGSGWVPVGSGGGAATFNPYVADTVVIDTSVTNNFPCVQKIIDSLAQYSNVNALAQVALYTVFGVNKNIHLTFKADASLPRSLDGDTGADSAYQIGTNFYCTIRLNSWLLSNSTKEYIAATIIHESIHAYIDFMQYQYFNIHAIDSTTFKNMFPLFWPPRSSNGSFYPTGNTTQHNVMAASLIQIMADALTSLYPNPNISTAMRDSIYRSLSWGGLNQTVVWANKTDTCDILAINFLAKDTSTKAPFKITGLPDCNKIYTNDFKSFHLTTSCQ